MRAWRASLSHRAVESAPMGRTNSKRSAKPALKRLLGEPSWKLASNRVEAYVTRAGGHLGPIVFDRRGKKIAPMSVAPWAGEKKLPPGTPPIIRVLRGDFFCLPFGGNGTPYGKEKHPVHGETAN